MNEAEKRLEELEIRLSHQEFTIQELSAQMYEQRQVIDQLSKAVRGLTARLKDLHPGNGDLPQNERPPHY